MRISSTRHSAIGWLATAALIAAALLGCANNETVQPQAEAALSRMPSPTVSPTAPPTPTLVEIGPLVEANLDPQAAPVDVPLELEIPALKVNAPILGVGLTAENVMDAPKGPIGDAIWHTAFWYRDGGIPGQVGTATIAGHVNDPLGRSEIFANLQALQPGDEIIVHLTTSIEILFTVDQVKVYSLQESSDPLVLSLIYGAGPVAGTGPQPAPDGLSHLTLITCAGAIVNGEFDHHTVVFATRRQ
jgi:sortase (surface protein transpeptidase)